MAHHKPRPGTSLSAATRSASTGVVFGCLFEVAWSCEAGDVDRGVVFLLAPKGGCFPHTVSHHVMSIDYLESPNVMGG